MIIPLGHEQTTVRRQPWVTWTIIGLCFLAFLATYFANKSAEERVEQRFQKVLEYYRERPYLELDSRLKDRLFAGMRKTEQNAFVEVLREASKENTPESTVIIEQHQLELNRLTEKAFSAEGDHPYFTWGFIPAHKTIHGLITHQFMHGGWMHLLGNMFFLFLVAPFIEDVWGRPVFAGFYLTGGIVAALFFALRYPDLNVPLIGASGAVAAVMGAFLVRYTTTKIKFFYFFFLFRGVGTAPAWLMLPLWFVRELFFAQAMDVGGGEGGGGVAHWAHVAGFAFGAMVAFAIRHYKLEEKHFNKAIEGKVTVFDNTALDEALEKIRAGNTHEGLAELESITRQQPENLDAAIAFWNHALALKQPALAAPAFMHAVQRASRANEIEAIDPQFLELASAVPDQPYDPVTALKLSEWLREQERYPDAEEILGAAARSLDATTPAPLMLRMAREGARVRAPITGVFAEHALNAHDLPDEARAELEELLNRFPPSALEAREAADDRVVEDEYSEGPAHEEMADDFPDDFAIDAPEELQEGFPNGIGGGELMLEEEAPAEPRSLQLQEGQPVRLENGVIVVVVQGREHRLLLEQLEAVAVAGIAPPGERSYIIMDLLLDTPLGKARVLRCLRAKSTTFDPRRVVGGDDPMAAFRQLLTTIVQGSGASCLPDPEIMNGSPLPRFGSLAEYEIDVLEVGL